MELKFKVPEISCGHCKQTIESTIGSLDYVQKVDVDIENKLVSVDSNQVVDLSDFEKLLDDHGYTIEPTE
ncbi:MAG: cation transporter [Actinomycetota bacterium]|nr:cation transporter [Actinomycetota bacterium]MDA3013083.1 cation transporter [Actinomycetota bacterium]